MTYAATYDRPRTSANALRVSRRRALYREVVVCVYSALGHNPNNLLGTTFEFIKQHPATLQDGFGFAQGSVAG